MTVRLPAGACDLTAVTSRRGLPSGNRATHVKDADAVQLPLVDSHGHSPLWWSVRCLTPGVTGLNRSDFFNRHEVSFRATPERIGGIDTRDATMGKERRRDVI